MRTELQKELYNRHLKLLNKTRYTKQYANYAYPKYGIGCDDGWFKLLDDFLTEFESCCLEINTQPLILQIKEKFGTLRVYFTYTDIEEIDDRLDEIVEKYTNRSMHTCEFCGIFGEISNVRNYLKCVCGQCKEKYSQNKVEV